MQRFCKPLSVVRFHVGAPEICFRRLKVRSTGFHPVNAVSIPAGNSMDYSSVAQPDRAFLGIDHLRRRCKFETCPTNQRLLGVAQSGQSPAPGTRLSEVRILLPRPVLIGR